MTRHYVANLEVFSQVSFNVITELDFFYIMVYIFCVKNFQIKKKQRELLQTLESLKIEFETIDISDPTKEEEKKFMRANSQPAQEGKVPLPPQVFKDEDYCGVSTHVPSSRVVNIQ